MVSLNPSDLGTAALKLVAAILLAVVGWVKLNPTALASSQLLTPELL